MNTRKEVYMEMLPFAVMTIVLLLAVVFGAGYLLGGVPLGILSLVVALLLLGWYLHRAYWPQAQDAIAQAWKSIRADSDG